MPPSSEFALTLSAKIGKRVPALHRENKGQQIGKAGRHSGRVAAGGGVGAS